MQLSQESIHYVLLLTISTNLPPPAHPPNTMSPASSSDKTSPSPIAPSNTPAAQDPYKIQNIPSDHASLKSYMCSESKEEHCVRHKDKQFTHLSNYTKGKEKSHGY